MQLAGFYCGAVGRIRQAGLCSARGNDWVRRLVACIGITLVAASCRDATAASTPLPQGPVLLIHESPSPFTEVTAGPVRALIPDSWHPQLAGSAGGFQEGVIASPHPNGWARRGGPVQGMAALWVNGARVGVPSDYYYLAATGPALDLLTRSPDCSTTRSTIAVDHRPSFFSGTPDSPGDYVARGQGTCTAGRTPARWAYFVAAPGFGPVRAVGIPTSGLYVVVAVLPDTPHASALLNKLLKGAEFGGASVSDLIHAAKMA